MTGPLWYLSGCVLLTILYGEPAAIIAAVLFLLAQVYLELQKARDAAYKARYHA